MTKLSAQPTDPRPTDPRQLALRWRYPVGGVVLMLAGFITWLFWPPPQEVRAAENDSLASSMSAPVAVQVAHAVRQDLALRAEATGTLRSWRQVEVSAEVGGKVVWRGMEEGQRVAAGGVVLRLDDAHRRLELAEAEADLLKVKASFAVSFALRLDSSESLNAGSQDGAATTGATAKLAWNNSTDSSLGKVEVGADHQRALELFAQGMISQEALDRSRRRNDSAQILGGQHRDTIQAATAGLTQAELRVERARLDLANTQLRSPFGGRVADVQVELGQQINAGSPCFLLLDDSNLSVDVAVLEADIIRLRLGTPAQVQVPALGDQIFEGRVHTINPRVDRDTGTGRATVVIANPDGQLMPGLFAYVSLETGRLADRLQVPSEAILERQDRQLVFRIEGERALWTYVKTGARSGDSIEILDGLNAGDVVAVGSHFALAHEALVEVTETAAHDPQDAESTGAASSAGGAQT